MDEKRLEMETLVYNLNIFFYENYDFEKIDIFEFEKLLEDETEILKKEYIFDNSLTLESYDVLKLNTSIRCTLSSCSLSLIEKIKSLEYIKEVKVEEVDLSKKNKEMITISLENISNIIENVDNIFYIRKKLYNFKDYIKEEKQDEFKNLIKDLSELKYNLKRQVFDLRVIDLKEELKNIQNVIMEYIDLLGLRVKLNFNDNNFKVDKILFFRIKNAIIDVLHSIVMSISDYTVKLFDKGDYDFEINFCIKQEVDKLYLSIQINGYSLEIDKIHNNAINAGILKSNYDYSEAEILTSIFNKNYINSAIDLYDKERLISYIKYRNIVDELGGDIFIHNEEGKSVEYVTKIPLNIILFEGFVFSEDKKYYVLDNSLIVDIFDFNPDKVIELNSLKYYQYDGKNLGYINLPIDKSENRSILNERKLKNTENRKGLLIKSNNRYTVIDVCSKDIYYEEIYMKKNYDSKIYMGDYLLKSLKRAKVIDLCSIIKMLKG